MIAKKLRQVWFVVCTVALAVMGLGTAFNLHAQNCDPPSSGLVSWWPGEANAVDIVGANNGVLQGGLTFVGGEVGQAFSFNGTSQYVRIADAPSLNPAGSFSLEAWIYETQTGVGQIIIGKWGDQGDYFNQRCYALSITPNNALQFAISDYPHQFDTAFHQFNTVTNAITPNSWMHVAAVYDQSTGTRLIYINGALAAQRTDPPITILNTNTAVGIGAVLSSSTQPAAFFGGGIDEVSLYNRALSGAEIAAVYNAGSAGKCKAPVSCVAPPTGLVSWWPGETNAVDIVGANNGVVQGGLTFVSGEVGQSFNFNGTDADVMIPASASLNVGAGNGLTVDAWIKPADLTERPIVEWDSGSDFLTHFRYSSPSVGGGTGPGCLYADLKDTGGVNHTIASAAGLISPNVFQHVAMTYDKASGVATLYLNGAVVAQKTLGTFTPDTTSNLFLGLRAAGAGTGQRYQGLMDEVDVFSRVLSAVEIQGIYDAGSAGKCKGPVSCVPPPTGLISWWPGENSGVDIAGVNNDVLQGGLTFAAGEVGQAFSFNGTDADVKIPASASLNVGAGSGLTMDLWIKPNDVNNQRPLLEWNSGTHDAHFWIATPVSSLGSGPGSLYANLIDTNGNNHIINSAPGILVTNIFQHVALTYDKSSGTAVLYLNGAVVAQQNLGIFTPKTTADLYFGLRPFDAGSGLRFYGLMDEVDLYNRALSGSEIQGIYNAGNAGKCLPAPVPPSITTQPQSQTILAGNDATFSVSVMGSFPLTYQWFFNATNIISGATNSSFTVVDVQTNNAGNYSVVVSNSVNFIISSNALLTVNVPVCDPAPGGLVSWWPGETNALDIVNTNNGLLQVGVTFQRGKVGQAFEFDGDSGYISIPASPRLNVGTSNGLTIECWINPNDVASTHTLSTWNNGAELNDLSFSISEVKSGGAPGSLHVNLVDTSGGSHTLATTGGLVKTNVFQHVAVTYDKSSGVAVLYYNGILEAAQNLGSFTPQTSYNFLIGYGPPPGSTNLVGGPFSGLMDEVTLYGRALSSTEIAAIYSADTAGKCAIAPIILTQPQSQTLSVGEIATFTVSVNGSSPFTYQWRFGTNNLAGATNSTLTVGNIQTTNSGNYSVVVGNAAGFTVSSNAVLTVNPPVCDAAPSGLVSWWRGESDAVDNLGVNSGFLQGGMAFANGQVGQAFSFNGTDADVKIPASASLNVGAGNGLTVDLWINPNDVSSQRPLIEWNSGTHDAHFWIATPISSGGTGPGSLYANLIDANGNDHIIVSAPGIVTTNVFQHVALTYDKSSGNAVIYLNGAAVMQQNLGIFTPKTTADLYLGLRPFDVGAGLRFYGLMDEVDLFNRALSASEILAIYNSGAMGKCVAPPSVAPSILTQPQSQTVRPGANITLTVLAAGSTPLHYQWRYNGANVPGATTAALYLTNIQPSQAGNYSVVITNSLNANNPLISSNAALKVNVVLVQGNGQTLTNSQYTFIGPTAIQLQNAYPTGLVYYTLDGSTPTFNSTQYSGPFVVSNNVIIRALGYSPDFAQSGQTDPIALTIIPAYSLTLTTAGGGTVSANPPFGPYTNGAVVTLIAHPASGWTFFQWLGDASGTNTTNTVVIDRNESARAVFGTTLSTTVAPSGSGSVMLNPPGGLYPYGTTVLISALPQTGNYFVVWDNAPGASGNANPLSYTVTNPNPTVSSLFATLNSGQVALAVVPVGRGRVSVNPSGNTFNLNQSVTVTATPNAGQSFTGWSGDASGAQNPLPVTLTQSKTIYANFSKAGALSFQPLGLRSLREGFELTLNGEYATAYRIDGSTNLTDWVPLITLTNSFGTLQFIDYSTTNFSDRFYRGVPLP